jgi:RNA ligase
VAEFTAWPKTVRLFRDIVISEKIDGTNAAIHITEDEIVAQSRKRLITPESDNFGFARWVDANADELVSTLGYGLHFGEWWGVGIQRGYNLQSRRFSLFNTSLWKDLKVTIGDVPVASVPVLYEGTFSEHAIRNALEELEFNGSVANPGFLNAEGICVFHTQTRGVFKVTLDNEDKGKWEG